MKIAYAREVNAPYRRRQGAAVTTKALAQGIAADYDAHGRLARIKILDAGRRLGDLVAFRQVMLEDVDAASPN